MRSSVAFVCAHKASIHDNPETHFSFVEISAPKKKHAWKNLKKKHDQRDSSSVFELSDVILSCDAWSTICTLSTGEIQVVFLHRLPAWHFKCPPLQTDCCLDWRQPSISLLSNSKTSLSCSAVSLRLYPLFSFCALSVFLTSWYAQRALSKRQTL